jgi:hypothetical protein
VLIIAQLPVSFNVYNKTADLAVAEVGESFIVPAVRKAVAECNEDDQSHTTAGFDGSLQKVGHNSLNGIMSATSFGTGEVLHVEIMSKFRFVFHTSLTSEQQCKNKL